MYPQTYKQGDFLFFHYHHTEFHQLLFFFHLVAFGGLSAFSLNVCLFQRSVPESAKSCNKPQNNIAVSLLRWAPHGTSMARFGRTPGHFKQH